MSIIEINLDVQDVDTISRLYDRIQLFRSPNQSGSPTPFSAITDDDSTSATVDGSISGPWNLNGQSLSIALDTADPVVVTFSGTNPFNLQTTLSKINNLFSIVLALEVPTNTNRIRLISGSAGTQSVLQVSGAAATTLGLSVSKFNGKGASPLLSPNTEFYTITDFDGLASYWYKARYINSQTGAASELSEAFPGGDGVGLPDSNLSVGKIALSDMSGRPIVGRRIIFVPTGSQVLSDGIGNNYGILPSVDRLELLTDSNGRGVISLIKGQRLKVFIEGTTFQREFIVPSTDFDILTVASVQPDPLSIVVVPPLAIRVS